MCMASDSDCSEPADMQPMELTRARMPRFISSQAAGRGEERRGGDEMATEVGSEHLGFASN